MADDLDTLRIHGDTQVGPGELDFAVNVHGDRPPTWLAERLRRRIDDLAAYPTFADEARARRAVARWHALQPHELDRHGSGTARVLPLAGSAEGFHLLAEHAARRGLRAAVVHPSFTEPEVELRQAEVPVTRVILHEPYDLDPGLVPEGADLVVVGNPTNPTSVLHPRARIAALCRPGRVTVVDEAFCDVVDDEAGSTLAGADLPGLVVLRSVTKTWALAGLRAGYAVGEPAVPPTWPRTGSTGRSAPSSRAVTACCSDEATANLARIRQQLAADRAAMRGPHRRRDRDRRPARSTVRPGQNAGRARSGRIRARLRTRRGGPTLRHLPRTRPATRATGRPRRRHGAQAHHRLDGGVVGGGGGDDPVSPADSIQGRCPARGSVLILSLYCRHPEHAGEDR